MEDATYILQQFYSAAVAIVLSLEGIKLLVNLTKQFFESIL